MSVETVQLVTHGLTPAIGAAARATRRGVPNHERPIAGADDAILSSSALAECQRDLVRLLNSGERGFAGDAGEARQCIARAAVLLHAEVRRREALHLETAERRNRHLAPWQARRAIEFVEANLAGRIRIEHLADVARLGTRHFSRAFRRDFGTPPYAYVVRRRVERAKEMMLLTDEPLAFIAAACGLSDQAHLTRLFRRAVGASPANWRRVQRSAEWQAV